MVLGNWTDTCKRMRPNHYPTLYTNTNSKLMNDLNIRPEAIKLLPENTRGRLLEISLCKNFENWTPDSEATKANRNKRDDIKVKSSAQHRKPMM